jgi:peptidylprolyl isomerase/peptidyl-prolyl cis-trans isomerase B (cyclophilin B)
MKKTVLILLLSVFVSVGLAGCAKLYFKPFAKAEKGHFVVDEEGDVTFIKSEKVKAKPEEKKKEEVKSKKAQKIEPVAVIRTSRGTIVFKFFPVDAPIAVENFKKLAQKGFYNKLKFHRVVPDFVIQGGDPNGDGTGGPGYTIQDEFNARPHLEGTVAMARTEAPNSAGSQFYICLSTLPQLDGKYTVFGQVTEGLDVIHEIQVGDAIESVTVEEREVPF